MTLGVNFPSLKPLDEEIATKFGLDDFDLQPGEVPAPETPPRLPLVPVAGGVVDQAVEPDDPAAARRNRNVKFEAGVQTSDEPVDWIDWTLEEP